MIDDELYTSTFSPEQLKLIEKFRDENQNRKHVKYTRRHKFGLTCEKIAKLDLTK